MVSEKVLASRIVLIVGDEDFLRREAMASVFNLAGIGTDDFDLETFVGDESSPATWIASAGTAPFLAERRTVVVRHLLRCDVDFKKLNLKQLPEFSLLILVGDEVGGSEDRIRKAGTVRKAWEKAVAAAGGSVILCDPDPGKVPEKIRKRCDEFNKSMTGRAMEVLVEMTGGSASRAIDELDKLILYVGDQAQIKEADVLRVAVPNRDWNVYRMVDAIFAGEVGDALKQLRILAGANNKPEDAAFSRILPNVMRHLRLLWQGRLCVDARCTPANAPESVRRQFLEKPNLLSEYASRQNAILNSVRNLPLSQLARCFAVVADTDARLKGGLDAFSTQETLERMVLDMAQITSKSRKRH